MGCPSVDRVLQSLTAPQLREWEEYFQLEPFGQSHTDYLLAQLTAALMWVNGNSKVTPNDFLPFYRAPKMTAGEISSVIKRHLSKVL